MVGRLYFGYISLALNNKTVSFLVYVGASFLLRLTLNFYPLSTEGTVDVAVESLEVGVEVEKWYPVTLETSKTNGGDAPSIRLKFKYQVAFYFFFLPENYFQRGFCIVCCLFVYKVPSVHTNAFSQEPITRSVQIAAFSGTDQFIFSIILEYFSREDRSTFPYMCTTILR